MPTRTSATISKPGFVANQESLVKGLGGQIDYDAAHADFEDSEAKVVLKPGTPLVRLASGKLAPRYKAEKTVTLAQAAGTATGTSTAHGYAVGQKVRITGADQAEYNGIHKILTVPTANTFTFAVDSGATSPATGTIKVALIAQEVLLTAAREGDREAALSGHGTVVGGVVYGNLMPNISEDMKAELRENDCTFRYETYSDSRLPA